MMYSTTKTKRLLFWIVVTLGVLTVFYWLALPVIAQLLRHPDHTLSVLAWIDAYKQWFFVVRFSVYAGVYGYWDRLLRCYKPDIANEVIIHTRKFLVRFFIVYELFFGIHVIAMFWR
jgi:hypothetical protein